MAFEEPHKAYTLLAAEAPLGSITNTANFRANTRYSRSLASDQIFAYFDANGEKKQFDGVSQQSSINVSLVARQQVLKSSHAADSSFVIL